MRNKVFEKLNKPRTLFLALGLILLIGTEIVMTCLIPAWRTYFYDILQRKDVGMFYSALTYFIALMAGLGIAQGLKIWTGQLVSFQIRQAATKVLFKTWVKGPRTAKNYTQSMTEALRNSTEMYLESFVEVTISGIIVVVLIITNLHNLPVLSAALAYTAVVSAAALLFNKPMINADMEWQSSEGAFREAIGDIANGNEDFSSKAKFQEVIVKYYNYVRVVMYFTLFTRMKSSLASLIPYLLLAGSYFSGQTTLGDFMGGVAVFELIVVNATILLILYPKLNTARASYRLSRTFYEEIRND